MEYLVVMEVSQKQNYIFKTNRLSENIGASIIIREVTEELPKKYSVAKEFVFEGGGKSVYTFATRERAKEFITNVSEDVLTHYAGVELYMAMENYEQKSQSVIEAINRLYGKLERKKAQRCHSARLYGLGITKECDSTQLPAVSINERGLLISKQSQLKQFYARAKRTQMYADILPDGNYRFATEIDDLGGTQGSGGYLSVVVIDGNKMGRKIEKFRERYIAKNPIVNETFNENYKKQLRILSEEIDGAYKRAVREMLNTLARQIPTLIEQEKITLKNPRILPIRPLVLAGDDICFLANAHIGIALAEEVIKNIEKIQVQGMSMYACAGVANVKKQYPFFRAHKLAEDLCHNAKALLPVDEKLDESAIDFHVAQGEVEGEIAEIRREKYINGTLTNKPYYIRGREGRYNSMPYVRERLKMYEQEQFSRSVINDYRVAMTAGEENARQFLTQRRLENRILGSYVDGMCIDFDVIEMIDTYHTLGED